MILLAPVCLFTREHLFPFFYIDNSWEILYVVFIIEKRLYAKSRVKYGIFSCYPGFRQDRA